MNPGPLGEAVCEHGSFPSAVPSHCRRSDLSLLQGPSGCRAFSSWPLSLQKLDSGQLWISQTCSRSPSLVIGSSALRSSGEAVVVLPQPCMRGGARREPSSPVQRAPLSSLSRSAHLLLKSLFSISPAFLFPGHPFTILELSFR